jgi:hypothetical protein
MEVRFQVFAVATLPKTGIHFAYSVNKLQNDSVMNNRKQLALARN